MATKDEFYRAVEDVKRAAMRALSDIPDDMHPQSREGKIWRNLLSRLPEQIEDLKATFEDPNRRRDHSNPHDSDRLIIP